MISGAGSLASSYWEHRGGESVASVTSIRSSASGIIAMAHAAELQQEKAAAQEAKPLDEASAKCLECHGPYQSLVSAPPSFAVTTYDGEKKYNPHRYVPHDAKDIPACANCHEAHAVPPESKVAKPDNVRWCYFVCHHQQDFTPCSTCHEW